MGSNNCMEIVTAGSRQDGHKFFFIIRWLMYSQVHSLKSGSQRKAKPYCSNAFRFDHETIFLLPFYDPITKR